MIRILLATGLITCSFVPFSIAIAQVQGVKIPAQFAEMMPAGISRATHAVAALLVTIKSKGKVQHGSCTSFLVSSQIIMTNSHCFPALKSGEELSAKVLIKGPHMDDWKSYNVIGQPLLDDSDADILLAQLEEPVAIRDVIPLPIAVPKKMPKHPWRISIYVNDKYLENPRPGYAPTVAAEPCSRIVDPQNPGSFVGCTSRPGNSGSPVVNNAGEVVSIIKIIEVNSPKVIVPGTKFIVSKILTVFSTPMDRFLKLFKANTKLTRYLHVKGEYPWDSIRLDKVNYESKGHLRAIWP